MIRRVAGKQTNYGTTIKSRSAPPEGAKPATRRPLVWLNGSANAKVEPHFEGRKLEQSSLIWLGRPDPRALYGRAASSSDQQTDEGHRRPLNCAREPSRPQVAAAAARRKPAHRLEPSQTKQFEKIARLHVSGRKGEGEELNCFPDELPLHWLLVSPPPPLGPEDADRLPRRKRAGASSERRADFDSLVPERIDRNVKCSGRSCSCSCSLTSNQRQRQEDPERSSRGSIRSAGNRSRMEELWLAGSLVNRHGVCNALMVTQLVSSGDRRPKRLDGIGGCGITKPLARSFKSARMDYYPSNGRLPPLQAESSRRTRVVSRRPKPHDSSTWIGRGGSTSGAGQLAGYLDNHPIVSSPNKSPTKAATCSRRLPLMGEQVVVVVVILAPLGNGRKSDSTDTNMMNRPSERYEMMIALAGRLGEPFSLDDERSPSGPRRRVAEERDLLMKEDAHPLKLTCSLLGRLLAGCLMMIHLAQINSPTWLGSGSFYRLVASKQVSGSSERATYLIHMLLLLALCCPAPCSASSGLDRHFRAEAAAKAPVPISAGQRPAEDGWPPSGGRRANGASHEHLLRLRWAQEQVEPDDRLAVAAAGGAEDLAERRLIPSARDSSSFDNLITDAVYRNDRRGGQPPAEADHHQHCFVELKRSSPNSRGRHDWWSGSNERQCGPRANKYCRAALGDGRQVIVAKPGTGARFNSRLSYIGAPKDNGKLPRRDQLETVCCCRPKQKPRTSIRAAARPKRRRRGRQQEEEGKF